MSIKEQLHKAPAKFGEVTIPELDGETALIKLWTFAEKQKVQTAIRLAEKSEKTSQKALVDIIIANVFEADETPAFTEQDREQLTNVASGKLVERLFVEVCKANALEDVDSAKKN